MINFKNRNKAKGIGYGQAGDLLQRFHKKAAFVMEMLSPWGLHYHLVFNMLSHILPSIVQLSSLKKADNLLNKENQKKKKERTKKKKEDDRDHYRVSFMETASPWGAHVIPDLWYCTGW